MRYGNEKELLTVIANFESATIRERDWHHEEHLIVACRYVLDLDFENAVRKMRVGLQALLKSFGAPADSPSPYHETLTVFWMRSVENALLASPSIGFSGLCERVIRDFDKDLPLKYYSRGLLFSETARRTFVEPDLVALNNRAAFD